MVLHDEELGDIGLCSSPGTQDGETLEVVMRRHIFVGTDSTWRPEKQMGVLSHV